MQATYHASLSAYVSLSALRVLACLHRRGSSMRITALLHSSGLATELLCEVLNELQERGWIKLRWKTPRGALRERLRDVDRVTITAEGRLFAPRLWSPRPHHRISAGERPLPGPSTG
jgi:hypothetical protein